MSKLLEVSLRLVAIAAISGTLADAQVMVKQEFPLQSNRDSFFEYTGVNWNLRGPNFFASFGQPFQGAPAFGNFNPQAGIQTGFAFGSGRFSGNFNFNFAQGYSRSSTTVAPVINSLNGYPASIQAGIYRPFVLGLQPVIGGGGFGGFGGGGFFNVPSAYPNRVPYRFVPRETPLQTVLRRLRERGGSLNIKDKLPAAEPTITRDENRQSVALRYFNSTGGTKASAAVATPAEKSVGVDDSQSVAMKLFRKGLEAEKKSKAGTARMYFRMASEKATGALKQRIVLKLSEIR